MNNEENVQTTTVDQSTNTQAGAIATPTETLHEYYWSNEDRPFEPVWVHFELTENAYPLVKDAPNPELKSPKYDWKNGVWNDNLAESINDRLNKTVKNVDSLAEQVSTMKTQNIEQQKQDQAKDTKNTQTLVAVQQMVATLGQNLGQQTMLIKSLIDAQKSNTSASTTTENKPATATDNAAQDTKEEGAE